MTLGPIQEYLTTDNTGNIFHDLPVVQLQMANAVSAAAQQMKALVQDITEQIKNINSLQDLVRKYRAASGDETTKGKKLGDDYLRIVTLVKYYVPDADLTEAVNSDSEIQQATIDAWLQGLSGSSQN